MNDSKDLLSIEKIFNMFSLFVIGTTSLMLNYFFLPSLEFGFKPTISYALIIFGFLSYEIVILSILPYYIEKGIKSYEKHKKAYFWLVVTILAFTYAVTDAMKEESYLVLIRNLALIILTIIFAPKITNLLNKKEPID